MRKRSSLLAAIVLVLVAAQVSYGQDIVSFHPLFSERDAVLIPAVEGWWEFSAFGTDTISFERTGDNFYTATLKSDGQTSQFEAVFAYLGNELFLDLFPVMPTENSGSVYQEFFVPVHLCAPAVVTKDTLRLASLKYRWFYDNVITKQSSVGYLLTESKVILTLPTSGLRKFMTECFGKPGFVADDLVARRIAGGSLSQVNDDRETTQNLGKTNTKMDGRPPQLGCRPSFPYKDGWLGGDGGLPVPISPTKTVWLFGDTYVGQKDQKTRAGANMVTTIGISTCGLDSVMDMQYFWRNMYTNHPDHFFQTHTNRYKFWGLNGFMYNGDLFVVMSKIGPLPGSSPDNIFNWSALGITLAKVRNPNATSPGNWKIELFPWSRAVDASLYQGGFAEDGKFAYLFMVKEGRQNYLLRLPLDKLESPDSSMEYFSKDETWKAGSDSADAKALFEDQLIARVVYLPELSEWLAVYGPHFGGTSIYFRTAPKIVGPWSERRVLYDCPELVKGAPRYDKDNFCYCAQVLSVSSENGAGELLISYSCNSREQSKLTENMAIYSPQVVEIPVPR